MAQKIIYYLLITLVLSLGFGQLLRFDFYSVHFFLHDILSLLILFSIFSRTVLKRNSWLQAKKGSAAAERTVLKGYFGIKIFLIGLTLGWLRAFTIYPLADLFIPALYTLRLLAYLLLFSLLKKGTLKLPPSIFNFSLIITALIGLGQYFIIPDMRWAQYLGFDDHLSRLILPHFDPTFTGVMISLAFLSFISVNTLSPLLNTLYFISILLTYSRSVWLSLLLTSMVFIKNKFVLLLVVSCMLLAIFALPQKFGEGTNLLRTFSITSRIRSDSNYIERYRADLLLGRGLNTLILDGKPTIYENHATGPNNSYLYLLLTTGILGLIGWGSFMYILYLNSSHKPMLIFFFISSLFNNVMFYPFALLWIILIETTVPNEA